MNVQFGNVGSVIWKVVGQFRRDFLQEEVDSYKCLLLHKDFNGSQKEVRATVKTFENPDTIHFL